MINLLGMTQKKELRAARLNSALLSYVVIAAAALGCIIILALFSTWWLSNRISTAEVQQKANDAQTAQYADIKAQGATFGSNLSKIQSVIANRSHYATALLNIAAVLPSGVSLQSLELSPALLTSPLKLSVTTNDYQSALSIRDQMATSKIFKSVTLDNADCPPTGKCTVNITASLNDTVFNENAV